MNSEENIKDKNYDDEVITFKNGYKWFNDSSNGREKLHENKANLRDSLKDAYIEYPQDKINNPEGYM